MNGFFGVLDRYVLGRLLGVWGLCIAGFLALYLVVDITSKADDILAASDAIEAMGRSTSATAIRYYATKLPLMATSIGPYLTLFAGIATLLSLARNNEYVPMIMAGRSVHRVLLPVYLFAATTVCLFAAAEEYVVPAAQSENAILDRIIKKKGRVHVSKIPHLNDRGNVFAASGWNPEERNLLGVTCLGFTDPEGRLPVGTFEASALVWRSHKGVVGWYPQNGVITPTGLSSDGRVVPPVRLPADRPVHFRFTPEEIDVLAAGREPGMTRETLLRLRQLHPQQHDLTITIHQRFTRPLSSLVLLLLGIPFVAGPVKRSIAQGLGVALFCCVAYFFTDFLFRELGTRGDLNPVVAAWLPTILFTSLAAALFDSIVT